MAYAFAAPGCGDEHHETAQSEAAVAKVNSLEAITRALWLPSYVDLFAAELEHNRHIVGRQATSLAPSSYRARLNGAAAEKYDAKMRRRERDQLAIELHANNMRCW